MRPSARAAFRPVSERLEGRTRNPYACTAGLVTVSVGCLIDPIGLALTLPWQVDGRPATEAEIRRDWQAVKDIAKTWGKNAWTAKRQELLTKIRLTDDGVDRLMAHRLDTNIRYLKNKLFPNWDSYGADAQLAIMLTAWALGAAFDLTKPPRHELVAAIRAQDWQAAKAHAHLEERSNKGVVDRNAAIRLCFDNATMTAQVGHPPNTLWWPNAAPRTLTLEEIVIVGEVPKPDPNA